MQDEEANFGRPSTREQLHLHENRGILGQRTVWDGEDGEGRGSCSDDCGVGGGGGDADDEDSVGSLASSVSTSSSLMGIFARSVLDKVQPVAGASAGLERRLAGVESLLEELHATKRRNWHLEQNFAARAEEIMGGRASGGRASVYSGGGGVGDEGEEEENEEDADEVDEDERLARQRVRAARRRVSRRTREAEKVNRWLGRLARPKRERAKVVPDGIAQTSPDWITHYARATPGIGEYDTSVGSLDTRGGKFSTAKPKTDIEWQIYRAQQYSHVEFCALPSTLDDRGGRFNQSAKPLTERDWAEKRARQLPAPGAYAVVPDWSRGTSGAGRFSTAKPKSDVEWRIHHAAKHPASHILLPSTLDSRGQRFNQSAKPLTERDWVVKRAKETPGPGQYKHRALGAVGGGKISESRPKSDVDWLIYHGRLTPGPGGYEVARALEASSAHKGAGRGGRFTVVYRPAAGSSRAGLAKGLVHVERAAAASRREAHLPPVTAARLAVLAEGREGSAPVPVPPPVKASAAAVPRGGLGGGRLRPLVSPVQERKAGQQTERTGT